MDLGRDPSVQTVTNLVKQVLQSIDSLAVLRKPLFLAKLKGCGTIVLPAYHDCPICQSNLLPTNSQITYNNKQLQGALIVAGWDSRRGGQVFCVPIGGTVVQEKWAADGSGSIFLLGYLDSVFR